MKQPPYKSFTDPVHGFVPVPRGLLMDLIESPEVQRLRRIRQLGVGHMVFPGAEHSRFGHAVGAMALMSQAIETLRAKGTHISGDEETSALAAALLHDIGHGPFSHTLESTLISGFTHELMSRELIVRLGDRLGSPLNVALQIFDNVYPRPFFHSLVSSQLDMDRLDYLRRDTYYTGVAEGAVGTDRIIRNLRVYEGDSDADHERLVVDHKGLHAVENFLAARRLMYWQVYLHKAVVAGDRLLRATIKRARDLRVQLGSPVLRFFLENDISAGRLDEPEVVENYVQLDDSDIWYSLKRWATAPDPILADLASRFVRRVFPRVTYVENRPHDGVRDELIRRVADVMGIDRESAAYYVAVDRVDHAAYERDINSISVVDGKGGRTELSKMAGVPSVSALTRFETRWYLSAPKAVDISDLV